MACLARAPGRACGRGAPACVGRCAPAPARRAAWACPPAAAARSSPRPPPRATPRTTPAGRQRPRRPRAPARPGLSAGCAVESTRQGTHHTRRARVQPKSKAGLGPAAAEALHGAAAIRVDDVVHDEREAGDVERSVRRGRSCPRIGIPARSCGRRPARGVSRTGPGGRPRGPRREHARTGQDGACVSDPRPLNERRSIARATTQSLDAALRGSYVDSSSNAVVAFRKNLDAPPAAACVRCQCTAVASLFFSRSCPPGRARRLGSGGGWRAPSLPPAAG